LALDKYRVSLTDIRGLGIGTTQQAKAIADHLVGQQLLERLSDTQFQVPERLQQRFEKATGEVAPQVAPQVTPQVVSLLAHLSGEMTRQELMGAVSLKDRKHFAEAYLQPALDAGLLEMTIPDKPQSSKQRYRLTEHGLPPSSGVPVV
jgi:ATP-dependent DNA helicase RecG